MNFSDRLNQVAERAARLAPRLDDESAAPAKHALVVPFIEALGYSPRDPSAVIPAFSAGPVRVDYALCPDGGGPAVLLACRPPGADLSVASSGPLWRAMQATDLPLATCTDGARYRFFSRQADGRDPTPFFTLRLESYDQRAVDVLRALRRDTFAPATMMRRASRPAAAPSVQDDEARAVVRHLAAAFRAFSDAPGATQDRLRPVIQIVARHLVRGTPSRPLASAVADEDSVEESVRALLRLFDARTGAHSPDAPSDAPLAPDEPDASDDLIEVVTRRLRSTRTDSGSPDSSSPDRLARRLEERLSS